VHVVLDAAHDWLSSFTPQGGAGRHQDPPQHTGQRGLGLLERLASVEGASRASSVVGSIERVGTHLTCFTRTKARVLTQEALQSLAATPTKRMLTNADECWPNADVCGAAESSGNGNEASGKRGWTLLRRAPSLGKHGQAAQGPASLPSAPSPAPAPIAWYSGVCCCMLAYAGVC
jgi:hypothetical protein